MKTYTEEEVKELLVAVQMFSSSNGNQGLNSVKGHNFGERAETMINAFNEVKSSNKGSLLSIISKFKN